MDFSVQRGRRPAKLLRFSCVPVRARSKVSTHLLEQVLTVSAFSCRLLVRRRHDLQQIQQEVDEVQVERHRDAHAFAPGVLAAGDAEEVHQEVAGEDHHADYAVHDVDRARHADEDADDAEDDQTEQSDRQVAAQHREVDAGQHAHHARDCAGAGGAQEAEEDRLPAEFFRVRLHAGSEEESADEGPAHEQPDRHRRCGVGGEHDDDGAADEGDEQHDEGHHRADVATHEHTQAGDAEAAGEQEHDFAEESREHVVFLCLKLHSRRKRSRHTGWCNRSACSACRLLTRSGTERACLPSRHWPCCR